MAPQPLSKVKPDAHVKFGKLAFELYPELTSFISHVINVGAVIEGRWSLMLADFLRADPKTAMAMYQAIASSEGRRAAILAAAKSRLKDKDDFFLLQAVAKVSLPQRKTRNTFAHHIWGTSPEIADALLLADPAFFIDMWVEYTSKIEHHGMGVRTLPASVKLDKSKIDVWSRRSMVNAVKLAEEADKIVRTLADGIHSSGGSAIHAQQKTQLLKTPQVAQAHQVLLKQNAQ